MSNKINNLEWWYNSQKDGKHLTEAPDFSAGPQDGPMGVGPPMTDPHSGIGNAVDPNQPQSDPNVANQPGEEKKQDDDLTQDPESPDMSGMDDSEEDFEIWKANFFDLAVKGDPHEMMDAIGQVRERKLKATQRRFVEDNMEILLLRQDANYDKPSKEVRKLISQELDRNNPGMSIMQHLMRTLEAYPLLQQIYIKLCGQGARKADLHRKHTAAILGAVQVGGGSEKEDLIYASQDYTINVSTRFYTKFGDINIGNWSLQEDDPEQYLSERELEKLEDGSPEEKRVLRRRIVLESISEKYQNRAFLFNIVEPDTGTIHWFGWDIAEGLRAGYKEGKLVVRRKKSEFRDAMIDDNGAIVPLIDLSVMYKDEQGNVGPDGTPADDEVPFMERRHGTLYLTASNSTIETLSGGMPGMVFESVPYQGNPSDLTALMRCAPSVVEMLMRRCT